MEKKRFDGAENVRLPDACWMTQHRGVYAELYGKSLCIMTREYLAAEKAHQKKRQSEAAAKKNRDPLNGF